MRDHCERVAQLAYMNAMQLKDDELLKFIYDLGLYHELYEYRQDGTQDVFDLSKEDYVRFTTKFYGQLNLMTACRLLCYKKDENTDEYVERIKSYKNHPEDKAIYIVKIADLVDVISHSRKNYEYRKMNERKIEQAKDELVSIIPELKGISLEEDYGTARSDLH